MSLALWLLLACLAARANAADVIAVSGMKQLKELAAKHPFLVVELYAPWCGHCKKLEPEYAKAAAALKDHDPPITLAKVDATAKANEDVKQAFKVSGFPTLKIIKGDVGKALPYDGPRDEAGIVRYLKKQVLPAYSQLTTAEQVAAAKADADVLLLAYIADAASDDFKTFVEVSEALRNDIDFRFVTDRSLVDGACTADCASPFVVMHKRDEAEAPRYEGDFSADLLKTWAAAKSLPLVIKFGSPSGMKHLQKAFSGTLPRLIAVAKEESAELMEQLQQASKANDDLSVVLAVEKDSKRLLDYYGLKAGDGFTLLVEDPKAAAKYLKEGAKASDVPEFMREFQARGAGAGWGGRAAEGALERWLKSEEPPADNNGPVRVVTGKTFEADVFGSGKDVFLEAYAPWCGHCKKLAPIWEEVGKEFKDDAGIMVAKIDATTNDIPSPKISVRGYPTLVFVTAKGDVIPFSGAREKKDLIKFIKDKRTTSADGGAAAAEDDLEEDDEEAPKDEL
ncbi:hypothetical protein CHLNCDRAFT_142831 [Chlorella variabilis]|uniref:protein disulfide-isomerase n=1 Tax=Chlorella variabilis TaxID=554065 RepID=E1Z8V1_CHLVA|nr:hypothetical protein CHLNCDRAFT_142831 [Chlorella variabilis]EFN57671.1 hypothetical protein CHLNCDRAFT_142831 [Chlorella variabilis]|eukprot:XP_005849773.1 hypothetical protein CHLNCDRAFT_142831 [Chlorella variabilis]